MIEQHKECPKCGIEIKAKQDGQYDAVTVSDDFKSIEAHIMYYYPCPKCRVNAGWEAYNFEFRLEEPTND